MLMTHRCCRVFLFCLVPAIGALGGAAERPESIDHGQPQPPAARATVASQYSTTTPFRPEDDALALLIGAEWPDLIFSPGLSRAAAAYADASTLEPIRTPPTSVLRRVLQEAGVPETSATAAVVATTEDGTTDVLDHLRSMQPSKGPATHIGLGRVRSNQVPFKWTWAILLVERRLDLILPIPAVGNSGSAIPLSFRLRGDFSKPRLVYQKPDGRMQRSTPAFRTGSWFTVIPLGRIEGRGTLQILAENSTGAQVVGQFSIRIGDPTSDSGAGTAKCLDSEEPTFASTREAEAFLFSVVNGERRRHGLPDLEWDASLAAIAAAHSLDMATNGFVGHRSPTHGDLKARLAEAGRRAVVLRENLARDTLISSAHESLMASPGHRANILATDVRRIGIGAVEQSPDGLATSWFVTEIFASDSGGVPLVPPPD